MFTPKPPLALTVLVASWFAQVSLGQYSEEATAVCLSRYAKYNDNHTACVRPNGCKITHWGVTKAEQKKIVDVHNYYRNLIASGNETRLGFPAASNMLKMEWDPELAYVAQMHANQCKFEHDCYDCRRTDRYEFVGQNLYIYQTTRASAEIQWPHVIKEWYDEIQIAPPVVAQSFDLFNLNIGHFTQIAWATTNRIGCGYVTYDVTGQDGENSISFKTAQLYTCNYAPGGNFLGEKMYEDGNAASRCPPRHRRSKRFTALCEYARKTNKNVSRKKVTKQVKKVSSSANGLTSTLTTTTNQVTTLRHTTPLITIATGPLTTTNLTFVTQPETTLLTSTPLVTFPSSSTLQSRPVGPSTSTTTTTTRRLITTSIKPTSKPTFSIRPFPTRPRTTAAVTQTNKRVTRWWDKWSSNFANSLDSSPTRRTSTTRAPWKRWSGNWYNSFSTNNNPSSPLPSQPTTGARTLRFEMSHNGATTHRISH